MKTVNCSFKLKKELDSTGRCLIFLKAYYHNRRFTYSSGEKILPKYWDDKMETVLFPPRLSTVEREELQRIETNVLNLKAIFKQVINRLIINKEPINNFSLKAEIDKEYNINFSEKKTSTELFTDFIESWAASCNRRPLTKRSYLSTSKKLKDYEAYCRKKINITDVDLRFYDKYIEYLSQQRAFSTNSIGKEIKNIKTFLKIAKERGIEINPESQSTHFKVTSELVEKIYLSTEELLKIHLLDLTIQPKLERVRDLFLIGCFTGLRFSDLRLLSQDNISNGVIQVRTVKTDEPVAIPVHHIVQNILDRYNGETPRSISNQKTNDYLKEIGKLAEINSIIETTKTKAGLRVTTRKQKYELITVHTARRSFSTNAYLAGVPTISIMKITGHKTEKAFLQYIKISPQENAEKLKSHPFFLPKLSAIS